MAVNNVQTYLLVAPAVIVMLSAALFIVWRLKPDQRYLLWMGCALACMGSALIFQTTLDQIQIAKWSVLTGLGYLCGAWFGALAMGSIYGVSSRPLLGAAIGLTALVMLAYFSLVKDDIVASVHVLSMALGLIQVLPAPAIFRLLRKHEHLEIALYSAYLLFCLYTLSRPAIVHALGYAELNNYVHSQYWIVTTMSSMAFSLFFTFFLLGCAVKGAVNKLSNERDHDPLTGLLNRRSFYEAAEFLIRDRRLQPISLLVGDIDHFKSINDSWGHECGDRVLQNVSLAMMNNVRHKDLVARFGGEEFVLLLVNSDIERAKQVADRIREQVSAIANGLPAGRLLTISFGVTILKLEGNLQESLGQGDKLLYKAKDSGRNCVCIDPDIELLAVV